MIVAWGMLEGSFALHALTSLGDPQTKQPIVTACKGRWPLDSGRSVFAVDEPPADRRCDVCQAVWIEQQLIVRPFRELVDHGFSRVGVATRHYRDHLRLFSPADLEGFERWLGPCSHGQSPITRCTTCTLQQQQPEGNR